MEEKKLRLELNKLLIKNKLEDWELERITQIENELEELQDLSYECLMEISE